uniref:Uncharacterized protein n=1 Tax=Arundo donax TaxID=35708 RepID=A0A0A8Y8Q5_ARUDO
MGTCTALQFAMPALSKSFVAYVAWLMVIFPGSCFTSMPR